MSVEDGGAAGASTEVAPTAFTDVMSATFQQAVADGVPPAEAFAQAEAAWDPSGAAWRRARTWVCRVLSTASPFGMPRSRSEDAGAAPADARSEQIDVITAPQVVSAQLHAAARSFVRAHL